MQINSISNTNFEGKIRFEKELSKSKREYVERILNCEFNGETLRKILSKKSYNVEVLSADSKKTVHPKIYFRSEFKKLKNPYNWDYVSKCIYTEESFRVNSSVEEGAKHLKNFMANFERYKDSHDYSYNNFQEKILAFFKKCF